MRKAITLWANSQDDITTLQGALQQEFGNRMHMTQEAKPAVYRIEGEDHERHVGYTTNIGSIPLDDPRVRFIAKAEVDVEKGDASLSDRMKHAVQAIAEGRKESLVSTHSIALGAALPVEQRQEIELELDESRPASRGASGTEGSAVHLTL